MGERARVEETIAPIGIGATSSPPRQALLHAAIRWLAPAALGILVVVQAALFREWTCETFDEFTYLRMGICIYRQGDFQSLASPMCPPLPILLEYALPSLRARSLPGSEGWEWEVPGLIRQARLATSILVGVPLVCLVYAWLTRRRGWAAGLLGGGLMALSPTVIAAASIATTDACFTLFTLLALASLHRYQLRPSRGSFVLAGASMGLALASKQSAVFLFPVALVELLLKLPGRKPGSSSVDFGFQTLFWLSKRLGGLVALAFLVDWAAYGFGFAGKFDSTGTHATIPVIVPMIANFFPNSEAIMEVVRQGRPPLAIDTFIGQMDHASVGQQAFLMGQHAFRGWWYFFPVAIAIKSTPAELVMIALVVLLAARRRTWQDPARRLWLVSIAVLLGAGMCSSLNIGHRYMLPIYPLVALMVADWLGEKAPRPARRNPSRFWSLPARPPQLVPTVLRGNAVLDAPRPLPSSVAGPKTTQSVEDGIPTRSVGTRAEGEGKTGKLFLTCSFGALLLVWQTVSIIGITPHYLAYFNTFSGGPSQGYRYLVDSSLDWGQDLPGLRRELEARHYQKVALCYFGTANAPAYNLRATDWLQRDDAVALDCDWLAISATAMQGAYGGPTELLDRFRALPSVQVGYSIFLYDLKDPRIRAVWDAVRHGH